MRFFIADDVSDSRDRIARALREKGHEVQCYESGWELLEALADDANPCDAVITDARMSFPDGLSVATLARGAGALESFVVLTGLANERARKVALGIGDVTLLEAPADLERIVDAACRAATRTMASDEAPRWVGAVSTFDETSKP